MADLRFPRLNTVILSGRLTRDPEVRYTPSGAAVCSLPLAFNRVWKDKNSGEFKEETSFMDVVVWGRQADQCAQQLRKGSPVMVEGELRTRSYENKEGRNVKVAEISANRIHQLEWTENRGGGGGNYNDNHDDNYQGRPNDNNSNYRSDVTDDDVPF